MRAIGYGCVRMERPDQLAQVLLAEDKGWPTSDVNELWEHSVNSPVALDRKIPVHFTYFTSVVDDTGKRRQLCRSLRARQETRDGAVRQRNGPCSTGLRNKKTASKEAGNASPH